MGLRAVALAAALSFAAVGPGWAACKVSKLPDLPVTMVGRQPLVPFAVNGKETLFMIDSGAFFSLISKAGADRLKLNVGALPPGFSLRGVGGEADVGVARARTFTVAGHVYQNVDFMVGGSDLMEGGAVGVVGQNVLHVFDVEYDLAGGVIRLMDEKGCDRTSMAYWAEGKAVGIESLRTTDAANPHSRGEVTVNGVKLTAMFDTGAGTSVLSLAGARRAGIRTDGSGVEPAGVTGGIGRKTVRTWLAPVDAFGIGGEEVRHTRLRIADTDLDGSDMLIGADFFLSHHVYVATERRLMFFTYNGGPVFDLSKHRDAEDGDGPVSPAAVATVVAPAKPVADGLDAGDLARRGAANASRGDLAAADADLTRAIALDPKSAAYLRQRARVRLQQRRPALARGDLDAALQLAPDDVDALTLRAELRLSEGDRPGASADLDAAAKASPNAGRLDFAHLYTELERFPQAVAQYDRWIALHPEDVALAAARNGRCWTRAQGGIELDKALVDCNAAVRMQPGVANLLDSRGLVRLRRGELALAIADYDAALKLQPKIAWSLYGRGVAKERLGRKAEGEADIAAAKALAPKLPDRAAALGIAP